MKGRGKGEALRVASEIAGRMIRSIQERKAVDGVHIMWPIGARNCPRRS